MFEPHSEKFWLHGFVCALLAIFCTMPACASLYRMSERNSPKKNVSVSTVVTNYPTFWEELGGVESISLAPMKNTTRRMGDEVGVHADILQRLKTNEWPKVYDRQGYLSGDEVEMLAQERQLSGGSGTRLILFTTLNDYRTEEFSETYYLSRPVFSPYYDYDANGNEIERSHISGYHDVPYVWTRNEAFVAISVRLIDIDTGKIVLAQNFKGDWWAAGSPPDLSLSTCLAKARDAAITDLITAVRVTGKTITLEQDHLRTASHLGPDGWVYTNTFSIQQEEFSAVATVPAAVHLNTFIVDVVVKDHDVPIVSHELTVNWTWDAPWFAGGLPFSPKEIATEGAGLRTYTLRLIQKDGMKILLTHDFKITK